MKYSIFLFFGLILFSCSDKQKVTDTTKIVEKPTFSTPKKHTSLVQVNPDVTEVIESWEELKAVNSFVKKFENVSPREALTNALELRDLVKSLKDSLMPKILDHPSFYARVNVLHNETLRLSDLTRIPAITADDISLQINKTIAATNAVNSKITTVLKQKRFEEEVEVDLDRIGIDSIKINDVTKNSIQKELERDKEGES